MLTPPASSRHRRDRPQTCGRDQQHQLTGPGGPSRPARPRRPVQPRDRGAALHQREHAEQHHEPAAELSAGVRTLARMIASLTEEAQAIGWDQQRTTHVSQLGLRDHVIRSAAGVRSLVCHGVADIGDRAHRRCWRGIARPRLADCVDSTRCVVYGVPNVAARAFLDRLGATCRSPWGGFSRF